MPKFYANSWECIFTERIDTTQSLEVNSESKYDYIFFFGEEELAERIKEYKRKFILRFIFIKNGVDQEKL